MLWYVDVDRWERQAALVTLIAGHAGPWPIELSPGLLAELLPDRTPRQVRYDHAVLIQLAEEDRVLQRWTGGGRRADVWRLVLDVRRWRHVPWLTRRSEFLRDTPMALTAQSVALMTKTAGQALSLCAVGAATPTIPNKLTRAFTPAQPRSTPQLPRTTPQSDPLTSTFANATAHNATVSDAPHSSLLSLSENPSLPIPPSAGGEGGREGISTPPRRELAWQVKERLEDVLSVRSEALGRGPVGVSGELWVRLCGLVGAYSGDPAILLARCDRQEGRFSVRGALEDLEAWMAAGAPAGEDRRERPVDLEARATNLRRLIATYRQVDPDDEHILGLRLELAQVEARLGGVPAEG